MSTSSPAPQPTAAPVLEPTVRLPVAVLAVVASLVVALVAIWAVTLVDTARLPTGPPRDPPAPPPQATTFTVGSDRVVSFDELTLTLPGDPYLCGSTQTPPAGFTAYVSCSHVVHENYDADHDWAAVSGILLVDPGLVTPGDVTRTTRSVFDSLVDYLYTAQDHPRVSKVSEGGLSLPLVTGPSGSRLANVNVRRTGLATPYDRLVVAVVELESGRYAAFYSDFPHDGGKVALKAVATSLSTLSTRR